MQCLKDGQNRPHTDPSTPLYLMPGDRFTEQLEDVQNRPHNDPSMPPYLVEVVKLDLSHSSTNAGSNGLAGISNKVWHREQFGCSYFTLVACLKMPANNKNKSQYWYFGC